MAESEYPRILEFLGEIGKRKKEFSLYFNPWTRYFDVIFNFILENPCYQHIFNVKISELIVF